MESLFSTKDLRFLDTISYPDLDFPQGETVFIRGESGSGKSTLLKLLNGTRSPSAGQVFFKGQNIAGLDTLALRRKAILVAQDAWLFPGTIRENFARYRAFRGEGALDDGEVLEYLRTCAAGLPPDTPSATLSGGERQRVFLAVCLSFGPEALLMDEPTSALDDETARLLFTRLCAHARARGMTLIAVSHSQALSDAFAGRVISLNGRASA